MREYEIMFILKPNLAEQDYAGLVDNFQKWITDNEGEIVKTDKIGLRDFATVFDHYNKGYYVVCEFKGTNKTLDEIYERMRVNENFMRHLNVLKESLYGRQDVDVADTKTKEEAEVDVKS